MTLSEKAKQAKRAYYRAWREKNAERVKASQERYWEKLAKAMSKVEESENDDK